MMDLRVTESFAAVVKMKLQQGSLEATVVDEWQSWKWLPGDVRVDEIFVYTDGSGSMTQKWPRAAKKAGWGFIVFTV